MEFHVLSEPLHIFQPMEMPVSGSDIQTVSALPPTQTKDWLSFSIYP